MAAALTLPDELVLIAYDDGGKRAGGQLDLAVAGAVLVELALAQRVNTDHKHLTVVDAAPTGDALLDQALARMAGDRPRSAKDWVTRLQKGTREQVLDRLVTAGLLRRQTNRVLGIFPVTRFPDAAPGSSLSPEHELRRRLEAVVLHGQQPTDRTAALIALLHAGGLRAAAFPDAPRRQTERRMKEVSEGSWAGEAVRKAVQEVQAGMTAAMAAVTAATAAATITSG